MLSHKNKRLNDNVFISIHYISKHKVFFKKHFTISFQSLFPLPLLYILAGIILGCLLLGICIYLIFKRYRAKIQPKLKDCHSVESNRRESKDLQSKSNKNLRRAKAKAKLKPKGKGRVVRQSLEFWCRDSAFSLNTLKVYLVKFYDRS